MQRSLNIHITKKGFIILAMVFALIIGVTAPLSANASLAREDSQEHSVATGPKLIIYASPESSDLYIPRRMSPLHDQAVTATINVNYIGNGWTPQAQAAFQYAADIWETLISSPVTIEVDAEFKDMSSQLLGYALATTIHANFTNAPRADTWYTQATANQLAVMDLDPTYSDITAAFNGSRSDWYFGTDSPTPSNKYSFATVVLHELGHGLGFFGSMDVTDGRGYYGITSGANTYPMIYDIFTENNSGTPLLDYTSGSIELATQLQSGNVFFDAPFANYANLGPRVELYAPGTWTSGSSYSHLDESFNGSAHALMTKSLNYGETVYHPGGIVLCMFKDMGWTVSEKCSETELGIPTLNSPSNGTIITDDTPAFDWNPSGGATQYQIQIDNDTNFSPALTDVITTTTSYTQTTSLSVDTYHWRVRSGDTVNWSEWSSAWSFTVSDTAPLYLPVILSNAGPNWTIIEDQGFEGAFPGTGWVLGTDTIGEYLWGKSSCRSFNGNYSAWAVGGGSSGSGLSCGSNYPNNVFTYMDYGPFDLSEATAAEMQFKFWLNSENGKDGLCWGVATDGLYFNYDCLSGNTFGWFDEMVDFSNFEGVSYLGEPQVWITFEFYSDEKNPYPEGAYVDDIVIRKCTVTSCTSTSSAVDIPPDDNLIKTERPSIRVR